MKVQFFGETRKQFADVNTEGSVPLLGVFEIKELLLTEKWQEATEATLTFTTSEEWAQNNLFPGRNPGVFDAPFRRALYFTFRKENNQLMTFIIENAEANPIGGSGDMIVQINGSDPRAFAEKMSSSSVVTGENWNGSRLTIAQWLTQRLSNTLPTGMEQWQALPLTALQPDYIPTEEEAAIGIKTPSVVAPTGNVEIGIPDPLPVKDSIDDLFATWTAAELYPIDKFGKDKTESPWWDWGIRTRLNTDHTFSEKDGTMKLHKYSIDYSQTETMTYNSNNPSQHSYSGGLTSSRTTLYGPWAGIRTESVTPPEGANVENFLRSKAVTGTMNNSRLVVDCTINFSKKGVEPVCGMIVNTRIGSKIYPANVNEINHHFSFETGWTSSSPVFINMDSVDLSDPVEKGDDIRFVFTGDRFIIPTSSRTNAYYSWRVFVDGSSFGVYQGTSGTTSPGIEVIMGEAGQHQVVIQPSDLKYYPGWGRAFGFSTTVSSPAGNVNSSTNKNKLISVIVDTDYAHLHSETETGNDFRSYQFHECINLEAVTPEDMSDDVVSIGNDFRAYQYYRARKLSYAPAEYISTSAVTIGNNFRKAQYEQTSLIATAASQMIPDSVQWIYDGYRENQYYQSTGLTTAANESISSNLETIGDRFLYQTYNGCSNLLVAGSEAAPNVRVLPDSFRYGMYQNCTKLTTPAEEKIGSSTNVIRANFRRFIYQNTGLTTTTPEVLGSINSIGNYFRASQYYGTKIIHAAVEVLGNLSTMGEYFRASQYESCISLTVPAEEIFTNNITEVPAWFRQSQYRGCRALTYTPNEALNNNVITINNWFRDKQFENCSSLNQLGLEFFPSSCTTLQGGFRQNQHAGIGPAIAADEADMPNVTTLFTVTRSSNEGFRESQYRDSSIIEIGKEGDMPVSTSTPGRYKYRQFMNCPNISNNKKYTEGAIPLSTGVRDEYRTQQFYNSGIVYALKENSTNFHNSFLNARYRYQQYALCSSLIEAYREYDNVDSSGNRDSRYREYQYQNCVNLDPTDINIIQKSTLTPRSFFRSNQFTGTRFRNDPGFRIKYTDGTEVIEGQLDIPTTFYSDPAIPVAPTLTQACVYSANEVKIYWAPPSGSPYTAIVFERETTTDIFERVTGTTVAVTGGYETTFNASTLPTINPGRIRAMTRTIHFGSEILSAPVFVEIDTSAETCTNL